MIEFTSIHSKLKCTTHTVNLNLDTVQVVLYVCANFKISSIIINKIEALIIVDADE